MKTIRIAILGAIGLAGGFASAQTVAAPVAMPNVTLTIPAADLAGFAPIPGPAGPAGPQGIQGIPGTPGATGPAGEAMQCPTSTTEGLLTDVVYTLAAPQMADTVSGAAVFASSYEFPANAFKLGDVLSVDAGGTLAVGAVGRNQAYGIAIDGKPILPAVKAWVNANVSGVWRVSGDIVIGAVGTSGAAVGVGSTGSAGAETNTGTVLALDTTAAHTITVYTANDAAEAGDSATLGELVIRHN